MTKLTLASAIAAVAIAVTAPFTFAQATPNADTAPPAASSRSYEGTGPDMMYSQAQGPGPAQAQGPMQGQGPVQGQGPMQGQGPGQGPAQGGYGPGMMSGQEQGQGGYGSSMMGGYGTGWMGGYGGIWLPIVLVLVVAGLVVWVVKQRSK